jgi:hypothetical protein
MGAFQSRLAWDASLTEEERKKRWEAESISIGVVALLFRLWQNLPVSDNLATLHRQLLDTLDAEYRRRLDNLQSSKCFEPKNQFNYGNDVAPSIEDVEIIFERHPMPLGADVTGIYLAEIGKIELPQPPDWGHDGRLRLFLPSNPAIVARRERLVNELERGIVDPSTLTLNFARERELVEYHEMHQFGLELCRKVASQSEGIPLIGAMWNMIQDRHFRPVEMMGYWINLIMYATRCASSAAVNHRRIRSGMFRF